MNLFLRLLATVVSSRARHKVGVLGPCRTPFRVWPTDLDVLRHVNNGVYLSIMDLARVDLMVRAGLADRIRAKGWYPVVVAETITFHRSLTLFQGFDIVTSVIGWDDRAMYLTQDFVRGDDTIAQAVVKARLLGRDGERVTPDQLLSLLDEAPTRPELPGWVHDWAAATARRPARPAVSAA